MARLTYWVGVPCLLFYKIATAGPSLGEAGSILLVTAVVSGLVIGFSYGLAHRLGIPKAATGTFVQAAFRGNLTFVGLPVIVYAFSQPGHDAAAAEATALLAFGPLLVFYNVAAVLVLLLSRARPNGQTLGGLLKDLLVNPLLIACAAGAVYAALGWPLPTMLGRSLAAVGQMALPLALLCLGGSLVTIRWRGGLEWAAALVKVGLMPVLGYLAAGLVGLSVDGTRIALILLACPTATVSYILVTQIGGDPELASGAILLSTMLAGVSLALVLAIT